MRRPTLHITFALLTFTAGFLAADTFENLAFALPVVLIGFLLLKKASSFALTLHHLQVAMLTLILWALTAVIIVSVFVQPAGIGGCVLDEGEENSASNTNSNNNHDSGVASYFCENTGVAKPDVIWVGVLDERPYITGRRRAASDLSARKVLERLNITL